MFAEGPGGKRWLVKTYGGNEDRVATEALSNAIYREMGAVVPAAGLHERDGKKALAYPTVEGSFSWDGPSRQVGQHFMTDALLANHDVLGLENDNILKAPSGRRVRLDQGGTLEFRAMGQPKEFGHTVPEVESMMAKPSRQGYRSSKVTMPELRAQAAEIHRTLTPERIDSLVNQAPFKDSAMRERVRAALKARVGWMARFAAGGETVSIPHLQEGVWGVDLSEFMLSEGSTIQHLWDEAKHPRDEHGRFIKKLADLKKGDSVKLDAKTTIKRDKDGTLRVVRSGQIIKGFHHPADAARAALDRSVKSKDPDSVGGATSHKDFNAYLAKHPLHPQVGTNAAHPHQISAGYATFGGKQLTVTQAEQELALLRGRLQHAESVGKTDKYVQRSVPTLRAREQELKAKVINLGGNHHVAPLGGSPTAPVSASSSAVHQNVKNVIEDHPPGTKVYVNGDPSAQVEIIGPSPSGMTVQVKMSNGVHMPLAPSAFVGAKKVDAGGSGPKVGDIVHNPKNSYQGKIVADLGANWQLEDLSGIKAVVSKEAFTGMGNMKVGPHPDYAPAASPAAPKPGKKIAGKQANVLGPNGTRALLKDLHVETGDKIQHKKGGHIYAVLAVNGSGGVTVQGPTGTKKFWAGYSSPAFVQKADKSLLKLKEPSGSGGGSIPAASHASHVASVKADLASSLGGTPLSSASSAVFQTPSGKVLYKKPDGSVWNIETGVQQQVDPNVEPPKLTTLTHTLAKANLALEAKKTSAPAAPAAPPKPDASWDSLPTGSTAEGILVKNQGGANAGSLTQAQRQAVSHYTGSGYVPMNTQTRTPRHVGTVAVEKQIIAMDGAINATGGVPEDMVLWRGVNGKTAAEYQQNAHVGGVIRDNGFTSTSVRRDMAEGWGVLLLKKRIPKGTKGIYVGPGTGLSSHSGEQEFILKRGTAWEVVDVRQEGGKKVLIVEPISGHM